jgi:hypothetical protein
MMAHHFPHEYVRLFEPLIEVLALEVRQPMHDYFKAERLRLKVYGRHLRRQGCVLSACCDTGLPSAKLQLSGVLLVGDFEDRLVCGAKLPMDWSERNDRHDWKLELMKEDVWVQEWLPSSSGHR